MRKKCTPVRTPGIRAAPGKSREMQKCGSIAARDKSGSYTQSLTPSRTAEFVVIADRLVGPGINDDQEAIARNTRPPTRNPHYVT